MNIYTIVEKNGLNIAASRSHAAFLQYYREMAWDQALKFIPFIEQAFEGDMTEYYQMMRERIEEYKVTPPGVWYDGEQIWDGVYRTNSK